MLSRSCRPIAMRRRLEMRKLGVVVALVLAGSISGVIAAQADSGPQSFGYLAGVGEPLCGLAPDACPDVARADNGDTVAITGSGKLSIHDKTVTGTGTFVHRAPNGAVRAAGSWTATELLSFNSYGTQPDLPPNLFGGLARIRVHLSVGFDAVLEIDCEIGKAPDGHSEGVRLVVDNGLNFNQKVSGFTVFFVG